MPKTIPCKNAIVVILTTMAVLYLLYEYKIKRHYGILKPENQRIAIIESTAQPETTFSQRQQYWTRLLSDKEKTNDKINNQLLLSCNYIFDWEPYFVGSILPSSYIPELLSISSDSICTNKNCNMALNYVEASTYHNYIAIKTKLFQGIGNNKEHVPAISQNIQKIFHLPDSEKVVKNYLLQIVCKINQKKFEDETQIFIEKVTGKSSDLIIETGDFYINTSVEFLYLYLNILEKCNVNDSVIGKILTNSVHKYPRESILFAFNRLKSKLSSTVLNLLVNLAKQNSYNETVNTIIELIDADNISPDKEILLYHLLKDINIDKVVDRLKKIESQEKIRTITSLILLDNPALQNRHFVTLFKYNKSGIIHRQLLQLYSKHVVKELLLGHYSIMDQAENILKPTDYKNLIHDATKLLYLNGETYMILEQLLNKYGSDHLSPYVITALNLEQTNTSKKLEIFIKNISLDEDNGQQAAIVDHYNKMLNSVSLNKLNDYLSIHMPIKLRKEITKSISNNLFKQMGFQNSLKWLDLNSVSLDLEVATKHLISNKHLTNIDLLNQTYESLKTQKLREFIVMSLVENYADNSPQIPLSFILRHNLREYDSEYNQIYRNWINTNESAANTWKTQNANN